MLLGHFVGKFGRGFSKENKTTLVVMIGISTLMFEVLSYVFGIFIYNYEISIFALLIIMIKEAIYNVLIGIILFKPFTLLAEIINKSKDSYYLL